jgi:phospholipid/cholesterol/gamma-HCH transport system substrate-binding protein
MTPKKLSTQFKVGLFIFLGLVIFFVFVFSQGKILRGRGYELKIVFTNVGGLDPGAPVRVSGYRVGEVKNIALSLEQDRPKIIVSIRINPEIRLGRQSKFTVRSYGIIGEKYMEILPTGLNDLPLIEPGETLKGEDPLPVERFLSTGEDILKNLNTLLISLNKITADEKLKAELRQVVKGANDVMGKAQITLNNFNLLASNWTKTSSEINELVSEVRPEVKGLIQNVNSMTKEINTIVASNKDKINHIVSNLESSTTKLDSTFSDVSDKIRTAGDSFVRTSDKINDFVEKIQTHGLFADIISDTQIANEIKSTIKSLQQTSKDIDIAFIKLNYVSEQIAGVISDIRSGKGTIGKLVAKDELYNQVFEMVQDLKAHPWKLLFRTK